MPFEFIRKQKQREFEIPEDLIQTGITFPDIVSQIKSSELISTTAELEMLGKALINTWINSKKQTLEVLANGKPVGTFETTGKDYPSDKATHKGVNINLYRLKHGAKLDGSDLNSKHRNFIQNLVLASVGPQSHWLFEQGVSGMFGLNNTEGITEMRDMQVFVDKLSELSKGKNFATLKLIGNVVSSLKSMKSTISYADKDTLALFAGLGRKTFRNPDYIWNQIAFLQESALPQPLNREVLLFLANGGETLAADMDRSVIQADLIRQKVDSTPRLELLNVGVGAEHVSDIHWLLNNPEYDTRENIEKALQLIK